MKSTLELILMRHGETEWTESGLLHGHTDIPLSRKGEKQARDAARRLQGKTFTVIYSSPLKRAVQTATIMGENSKLDPIPLAGLSERYYGWGEGKPMFIVDPTGPKLLKPFVRLMVNLTGEREHHFTQRIKSTIETIINQHPRGRVLVVTHWGVLSMIMSLLMDGNLKNADNYGPWKACGLTTLQQNCRTWKIIHHDHPENPGQE